ncbi:hypothetical protein ACFOPQ_17585, partial [Deinococcus antarcticus]
MSKVPKAFFATEQTQSLDPSKSYFGRLRAFSCCEVPTLCKSAQYPTVSKNPVWDGEKRSIKAS